MKLPSFPKIAIPDAVKHQFEEMVKSQGLLAALQFLTPIEVHVKILAKVKVDGETEDIAFLYKILSGMLDVQHPEDLEKLLYQILAERGSNLKVKCKKVTHDGEKYYGVFMSRPKDEPKEKQ